MIAVGPAGSPNRNPTRHLLNDTHPCSSNMHRRSFSGLAPRSSRAADLNDRPVVRAPQIPSSSDLDPPSAQIPDRSGPRAVPAHSPNSRDLAPRSSRAEGSSDPRAPRAEGKAAAHRGPRLARRSRHIRLRTPWRSPRWPRQSRMGPSSSSSSCRRRVRPAHMCFKIRDSGGPKVRRGE